MVRPSRTLDRLTTLMLCPWHCLTRRARLYKAAAWSFALLLLLAALDQAFVLPEAEGWLGLISLFGALLVADWMHDRWNDIEAFEPPDDLVRKSRYERYR